MYERGAIRNKKQAEQLRDFTNLKFGNITPTDIDGYIDYRGKCQIFMEAKYGGAELPNGQKRAIEVIVNSSTIPAVAFVVSHYTDGMIDMGNCEIKKYYFEGEWRTTDKYKTLRQAVEAFLIKYGGYHEKP